MDALGFAVLAAGLFAYSLVSGRLQGTSVTPPMVFVAFGLLVGSSGLGLADLALDHGAIHVLAEVTLVLVLFVDAARIDLTTLRRDHDLPVRMLAIGLPLTIVAGTLAGALLLPEFSWVEAALLAAVLAPTDAALGQAVVASPVVPARIRQALNVESGLNDGITLPVVLLLATLASATADATIGATFWLRFAVLQVVLGPVVGIVVGRCGSQAIDTAAARGWLAERFEGLSALGLAMVAYACAEVVGGNGFIAAFVAGLVFGNTVRGRCAFLFDFAEAEGELLTLMTFLVFGAAMLPAAAQALDWRIGAYALLSLTAVRMLPTALALTGKGLHRPTLLFLGWFGPRGLASILFALLIVEEARFPHQDELMAITVVTVALSVLLHGLTAAPAARWYAALSASMTDGEEMRPVAEMPTRVGARSRRDVLATGA
jgi:NhaP-type Na+/H+ or K+/H+ antiporter